MDAAGHEHGHDDHDHVEEGDLEALIGDEGFWDERYRGKQPVWSGRPNAPLTAEAAGLTPGRVLDAGCGEGADAIWLAERGWQVTATDISGVALERAAARASQLDPQVADRIEWRHEDLLSWQPPPGSYDLVATHYLQLPRRLRENVQQRLAAAVAPGGFLLVVGHDPSDLQTTVPRPPLPELFFTAEEAAAVLDPAAWEVVVSEARPRAVTDPEGRSVMIADAVLRARRRTT